MALPRRLQYHGLGLCQGNFLLSIFSLFLYLSLFISLFLSFSLFFSLFRSFSLFSLSFSLERVRQLAEGMQWLSLVDYSIMAWGYVKVITFSLFSLFFSLLSLVLSFCLFLSLFSLFFLGAGPTAGRGHAVAFPFRLQYHGLWLCQGTLRPISNRKLSRNLPNTDVVNYSTDLRLLLGHPVFRSLYFFLS